MTRDMCTLDMCYEGTVRLSHSMNPLFYANPDKPTVLYCIIFPVGVCVCVGVHVCPCTYNPYMYMYMYMFCLPEWQ
jgi:hypothetical protein